MSSFLVAAFLALCVALVSGNAPGTDAVTLSGPCPNFPPQQPLESNRLSGDWIALHSKMNGMDRQPPRCVRVNLQVSADGVVNSTLRMIRSDNGRVEKNSLGTPIDGQKGKLLFTSSRNPERTLVTTILGTDYDNYFVMVNCQTVTPNHGYAVIILGRQPTLSPQLLESAKAAITAANINLQLDPVVQTNNCF